MESRLPAKFSRAVVFILSLRAPKGEAISSQGNTLLHNRQFRRGPGVHAASQVADIGVADHAQVHHHNGATVTRLVQHYDRRGLVGGDFAVGYAMKNLPLEEA